MQTVPSTLAGEDWVDRFSSLPLPLRERVRVRGIIRRFVGHNTKEFKCVP